MAKFEVRSNVEYSTIIPAQSEEEAISKASHIPFGDIEWEEAWASMSAEAVEDHVAGE